MTAPDTTENTKLVDAAPASVRVTGAVVGGTGDDWLGMSSTSAPRLPVTAAAGGSKSGCEGTSRGYETSGTGRGGKVEEAMGETSGRWRGGGGWESEEGI